MICFWDNKEMECSLADVSSAVLYFETTEKHAEDLGGHS